MKKRMSRVVSAVLAFILLISMTIPAGAEEFFAEESFGAAETFEEESFFEEEFFEDEPHNDSPSINDLGPKDVEEISTLEEVYDEEVNNEFYEDENVIDDMDQNIDIGDGEEENSSTPICLRVYTEKELNSEKSGKELAYTVCRDATFTISADAEGISNISWQYKSKKGKKWKAFTEGYGYNTETISFVAKEKHLGYSFRMVGTTADGTKVTTKAFRVTDGIRFTLHPENKTIKYGNKVTLTAYCSNCFAYRWQYSTNGKKWYWVGDTVQNKYAQYTRCQLSFTVTNDNYGYFRVAGMGSTGKLIYSKKCKLSPIYGLVTKPYIANKAPKGEYVSLSALASGAKSYQWQQWNSLKNRWVNLKTKAAKRQYYTFQTTPKTINTFYRIRYKGFDSKWHIDNEYVYLGDSQLSKRNCRALLIGQTYPNTSAELFGPANDVAYMELALKRMSGLKYTITTKTNRTASQIKNDIASAFPAASMSDNDISVFYYSGHGMSDTGSLVGTSNTQVTGAQLREYMKNIPGKKIIIIDACYSGNLIARDEALRENESEIFTARFVQSFFEKKTLQSRSGELQNGFYVLTSCAMDETSIETMWRLGSNGTRKSFGLFTNYLIESMGYSIKNNSYTSIKGDTNKDGALSLEELYTYTRTRVRKKNKKQSVRCYPDNSEQIVFIK